MSPYIQESLSGNHRYMWTKRRRRRRRKKRRGGERGGEESLQGKLFYNIFHLVTWMEKRIRKNYFTWKASYQFFSQRNQL